MPIGIVLFSWDSKLGSVIDVKYPKSLVISDELINKIYMTFAYSKDFDKEELIETSYNDLTLLSYCDKTRVAKVGYEIITLFLEEKEKIDIFNFKSELSEFGKQIFEIRKEVRNNIFLERATSFFKKKTSGKVLVLGRAGTGKTTIKKIVFEGADPKELLYNPLEPTRGISPSVYSWLDLNIGIFDSSGQELSFLLENKDDQEHLLAFENNDFILYIFDYTGWLENRDVIIDDVDKIRKLIESESHSAQLILFFHKIDLVLESTLNNLQQEIEELFQLPVYYTSIHPELIYNLYNAFYEILSKKSNETTNIKKILDSQLEDFSKSMYFLTDLNDSIIVQSMSTDFNTLIINHSHKLIAQIVKTFEIMSNKDNVNHVIISSENNLQIILNNIKFTTFGLKNLICISETLSANKLIWIVGQIKQKFREYLHFKKEI
jgi:hypothetical protein